MKKKIYHGKSRAFPLVMLNHANAGFVTSDDVMKLMGFVYHTALDIWGKYKQFGDVDEIKTQVIMAFCYLITKYRQKPLNGKRAQSVTSYCYRYGKQQAVSQLAIMRKISIQTTLIDNYMNELAAPIDITKEIERCDLIEEVIKRADKVERQIINFIQLGKTYSQISGILGISKGMITKRLHALANRIR